MLETSNHGGNASLTPIKRNASSPITRNVAWRIPFSIAFALMTKSHVPLTRARSLLHKFDIAGGGTRSRTPAWTYIHILTQRMQAKQAGSRTAQNSRKKYMQNGGTSTPRGRVNEGGCLDDLKHGNLMAAVTSPDHLTSTNHVQITPDNISRTHALGHGACLRISLS